MQIANVFWVVMPRNLVIGWVFFRSMAFRKTNRVRAGVPIFIIIFPEIPMPVFLREMPIIIRDIVATVIMII